MDTEGLEGPDTKDLLRRRAAAPALSKREVRSKLRVGRGVFLDPGVKGGFLK